MASSQDLVIERDGAVVLVTLNRPEVHNALSVDQLERLVRTVEALGDDDTAHVVVVRGAGRSFCAGYDVGGGSAGYGGRPLAADARRLRAIGHLWGRLWHSPLPVIAQVHGNCLAGGTDLALHSDLVLVADDARIGFPAVRSMGVALTQMWVHHLGPQWAKRLLLTGDSVTGRTAAAIGLALASHPPAELEAATLALAHRVATVDRELLAGNKLAVNHAVDLMGRAQAAELAAVLDAVAHQGDAAQRFAATASDQGLRAALAQRDDPFRSGDPIEVTTR